MIRTRGEIEGDGASGREWEKGATRRACKNEVDAGRRGVVRTPGDRFWVNKGDGVAMVKPRF